MNGCHSAVASGTVASAKRSSNTANRVVGFIYRQPRCHKAFFLIISPPPRGRSLGWRNAVCGLGLLWPPRDEEGASITRGAKDPDIARLPAEGAHSYPSHSSGIFVLARAIMRRDGFSSATEVPAAEFHRLGDEAF